MGIPVVTEVSKNQRGTKYGAVVAAVDIDNNGTHELLIGAPLYTSKYADEGRVYIYTSGDNVKIFVFSNAPFNNVLLYPL